MGETEQDEEHTCETLLMCIVTVLSHGLRSGGGVGDVLRKPSKEVAWPRAAGGGLQAGWGGRLQTRRPLSVVVGGEPAHLGELRCRCARRHKDSF